MKRIKVFMLAIVCLVLAVGVHTSIIEAKTLTKLSPKYYICVIPHKGCNIKLTKKKLTIKHFDIYPERDGGPVLKNGKAVFKLSKKCKYYIDNVNKYGRISFKYIKKRLKKHPKKMYSFKINSKNRVAEIRCK